MQTNEDTNKENDIKYNFKYGAEEKDNDFGKNIAYGLSNMQINEKKNFEVPDSTLSNRICGVVEHLFSDSSVLKDKFLMKHIKRNQEGYVSIELISSLRKVKALTRNWRVVARCLEDSTKLKLSEDGTKVKRLDSVPHEEHEQSNKGNRVVILKLPPHVKSSEEVKILFQSSGKISNVTLIDQSSLVGKIRTFCVYDSGYKFPYALVEFENYADALKAARKQYGNSEIKWAFLPPLNHSTMRTVLQTNYSNGEENKNVSKDAVHSEHKDKKELKSPYSSIDSLDSAGDVSALNRKRYEDIKTNVENIDSASAPNKCEGGSAFNTKWNQRRQSMKNMAVVIARQPKGPDGTIGFQDGRSKANLSSTIANF